MFVNHLSFTCLYHVKISGGYKSGRSGACCKLNVMWIHYAISIAGKRFYQMIPQSSLYYISTEKGMLSFDNRNDMPVKCANSNLHTYIAKIFILWNSYIYETMSYIYELYIWAIYMNVIYTANAKILPNARGIKKMLHKI